MSQIVRVIFGAMAVSLTLGAAQLASGGDLGMSKSLDQGINRGAKSDRAPLSAQLQQGETVLVGQNGQSILMRIPAEQLGDARRGRGPGKMPGLSKTVVACEPVVSILTEVARQLQPGRCVT
jgi:hypothetical protein